MNAQQAARWERTRQMGRKRYIQLYFVIGFGVTVALLLTLLEYATQSTINLWYFATRLLVFVIIGGFVGTSSWQNKERSYEQFLSQKKKKS